MKNGSWVLKEREFWKRGNFTLVMKKIFFWKQVQTCQVSLFSQILSRWCKKNTTICELKKKSAFRNAKHSVVCMNILCVFCVLVLFVWICYVFFVCCLYEYTMCFLCVSVVCMNILCVFCENVASTRCVPENLKMSLKNVENVPEKMFLAWQVWMNERVDE